MNLNSKITVSENSQHNDIAFAKTLTVNELFDGANALAKNDEVESIEITKFSDLVIKLHNEPGKIRVINYNGTVMYGQGCKPSHVRFVTNNFPKVKEFNKLNIF
jgi:hypothetical protein